MKETVKNLLQDTHFDINERDAYGHTLLNRLTAHQFTVFGERDLNDIRLLLEHGADPNIADNNGVTPLMNAAEQNSIETAKLLLQHGAKIDQQNKNKNTALHMAARKFRQEIMLAFERYDFDPYIQNNKKMTAIDILIKAGDKKAEYAERLKVYACQKDLDKIAQQRYGLDQRVKPDNNRDILSI